MKIKVTHYKSNFIFQLQIRSHISKLYEKRQLFLISVDIFIHTKKAQLESITCNAFISSLTFSPFFSAFTFFIQQHSVQHLHL